MAAAEVQGSEPHFLGFRDFGFSKSAEETFARGVRKNCCAAWCSRSVCFVRMPIITNHDSTSGHGHHQATDEPSFWHLMPPPIQSNFQNNLHRLERGVQRLFVRSRGEAVAGAQVVTLDPNETDPVRGITYAQQALAGLQKHATRVHGPRLFQRTVPVRFVTRFKQGPRRLRFRQTQRHRLTD